MSSTVTTCSAQLPLCLADVVEGGFETFAELFELGKRETALLFGEPAGGQRQANAYASAAADFMEQDTRSLTSSSEDPVLPFGWTSSGPRGASFP